MDFDPGFHEEMYESEAYESLDEMAEDQYEEGYEEDSDDPLSETEDSDLVETDELGNPILLASAAGMGYHMAQDELEERKLAEEILKNREGKPGKHVKVPLSSRHSVTSKGTPFRRWAAKVNRDPKRTKDPLEYTEEEQALILKHEAEGWPQNFD